MRHIIGLVLGLFIMANPVLAQIAELTVDNSTMPGDHIDHAFINRFGGLEIQSILGIEYEVREVGAPTEGGSLISNFTLNGETNLTLPFGQSAEINWNAANADGCVASTAVVGILDDWNTGTEIISEGSLPVTFQTAGNYILLLDCFTQDSGDTDAVTVAVEGASIINFSVTPGSEVVNGQEVTLTFDWETENAASCSGDWPGSATPETSGSQEISVTLNSSTIYTLTCIGASGDLDSVTDSVEILVPETQAACNVTLQGSEVLWDDLFKENWPGPSYEKVVVQIAEKGYLAIEFNTRNVKDIGVLSNIEAVATPGWRLGSVSRCSGKFDVEDEACTYKWGDHGGIFWDTSGQADPSHCNLDPNETYYWNMTFTDGKNPNTSRCSGSYCLTTLIPLNND